MNQIQRIPISKSDFRGPDGSVYAPGVVYGATLGNNGSTFDIIPINFQSPRDVNIGSRILYGGFPLLIVRGTLSESERRYLTLNDTLPPSSETFTGLVETVVEAVDEGKVKSKAYNEMPRVSYYGLDEDIQAAQIYLESEQTAIEFFGVVERLATKGISDAKLWKLVQKTT